MSALLVLIGLPGAGKTSAGRRAARRLQVAFADSDSLIEARAGATVSDIFAVRGETAFRALEADVIAEALVDFDGILALGGGAVTTPAVRAALAGSGVPVVHLATTAASALARVGDGYSRPLLRGDPAGRLVVLERERRPLYEEVSTDEVRAGGRPIATIVDELVELGRAALTARAAATDERWREEQSSVSAREEPKSVRAREEQKSVSAREEQISVSARDEGAS